MVAFLFSSCYSREMLIFNQYQIYTILAGVLLDKYERFRFWFLFAWSICNCITISLLPFSGYLPMLFFFALMMGYAVGSIHTGTSLKLIIVH